MPGKKGQVAEALVLQRVYGAPSEEAAFLPSAQLAPPGIPLSNCPGSSLYKEQRMMFL